MIYNYSTPHIFMGIAIVRPGAYPAHKDEFPTKEGRPVCDLIRLLTALGLRSLADISNVEINNFARRFCSIEVQLANAIESYQFNKGIPLTSTEISSIESDVRSKYLASRVR